MSSQDWQQAIIAWRQLSPEEQRRIALLRIPRHVARSMAFEGEPVDERMLELHLERLLGQPGLFPPRSES